MVTRTIPLFSLSFDYNNNEGRKNLVREKIVLTVVFILLLTVPVIAEEPPDVYITPLCVIDDDTTGAFFVSVTNSAGDSHSLAQLALGLIDSKYTLTLDWAALYTEYPDIAGYAGVTTNAHWTNSNARRGSVRFFDSAGGWAERAMPITEDYQIIYSDIDTTQDVDTVVYTTLEGGRTRNIAIRGYQIVAPCGLVATPTPAPTPTPLSTCPDISGVVQNHLVDGYINAGLIQFSLGAGVSASATIACSGNCTVDGQNILAGQYLTYPIQADQVGLAVLAYTAGEPCNAVAWDSGVLPTGTAGAATATAQAAGTATAVANGTVVPTTSPYSTPSLPFDGTPVPMTPGEINAGVSQIFIMLAYLLDLLGVRQWFGYLFMAIIVITLMWLVLGRHN